MEDQLAKEVFTCHICEKQMDHTMGTWLPIGEEDKTSPFYTESQDNTTVLAFDLRPPEIITSKDFTCYDCL